MKKVKSVNRYVVVGICLIIIACILSACQMEKSQSPSREKTSGQTQENAVHMSLEDARWDSSGRLEISLTFMNDSDQDVECVVAKNFMLKDSDGNVLIYCDSLTADQYISAHDSLNTTWHFSEDDIQKETDLSKTIEVEEEIVGYPVQS